MTSIVPIVCEIEAEYGSVKEANLFDPRLVFIRRRFNGGIDPLKKRELGIDINAAQRMLDSKMDKQDIADSLGIKIYRFQRYIADGYLSDKAWRSSKDGRKKVSRQHFNFYKNGEFIMQGTYDDISARTNISRASLVYYRSKKYKERTHVDRYRLVKIDN